MVFGLWTSPPAKPQEFIPVEANLPCDPFKPSAVVEVAAAPKPAGDAPPTSAPADQVEIPTLEKVPAPSVEQQSTPSVASSEPEPRPRPQKRFSWRTLVQPKNAYDRKPALPSAREEAAKEATARQEYVERQVLRSRSDKRARESALVVRELIVGPFAVPSAALPKSSKVAVTASSSSHTQKMLKVKSQLLEPKQAKKVIAQLRQLPSSDVPVVVGRTSTGVEITALSRGPIHAVCLPYTEAEATERHFAKLDKVEEAQHASPKVRERSLDLSHAVTGITSVTATSLDKLRSIFKDINVVSLISVPNWGLGQAGDQPGLLAGALPSAKAVIEGVEEITPQLMALGYATGKSILPSHEGVYPPTDRMSVLTYWWGLEVVIPETSVQFLSNVPSVAHTVVNFLTALSVANGGVAEILPFIRYISTYIDMEFGQIQGQDQGKGVVCAATWIMPAALVPRPWDFPDPPATSQPATTPDVSPTDSQRSTEERLPGVVVIPPTPPASESLGKATGVVTSPDEAADKVVENGAQTGSKEEPVNGAPVA